MDKRIKDIAQFAAYMGELTPFSNKVLRTIKLTKLEYPLVYSDAYKMFNPKDFYETQQANQAVNRIIKTNKRNRIKAVK